MHPGIGVGFTRGRLALRDFVLMVRKLQVAAAAMNIEGLTQAAGGHHRAFDMPARTTRAPRRFPARLARLDAFPQHEVQRIVLGLIDLDARADTQILDLFARQLAVAHELGNAVVHVTIARGIGVTLVDQGLDHCVHARDMVRGTGLHIRLEDIEARLVFMHCRNHALGQRLERLAVFAGTIDDLVFNVRDIAHIGQVITAETQPAGHQIEGNHAATMANVAVVVHGHAAHVHAHIVAVQRLENFFALGERVVDRKHGLFLQNLITGPTNHAGSRYG